MEDAWEPWRVEGREHNKAAGCVVVAVVVNDDDDNILVLGRS